MTQQNQNPNPTSKVDDDEIDLIALATTVWSGRKTIIKTIFIFMAIGLFVAIFSEKEYTTSTTFVSQTSDSKVGGSLGGLAAMAGINLGSMGGDSGISPELYPQIINSIPFQVELLQTPLTIEGQKEKITYTEYYTNIHSPGLLGFIKKYTIGLPGLLIKAIKGEPEPATLSVGEEYQLLTITLEEHKLIKRLSDQIGLEVNDKDGYVTIYANMPEAVASAELAYKAEELLQEYLIDFKVQKSNNQLEFIKARYLEVEKKFKTVQQKLAIQRDRNQYLTTALAKTTSEILQDEYNLIYGVYSELAKQLEAQYIQVTEDTPVFTVLNPASVPIEKSKPKRAIILLIWTFLGLIVGLGVVLGSNIYAKLKDFKFKNE